MHCDTSKHGNALDFGDRWWGDAANNDLTGLTHGELAQHLLGRLSDSTQVQRYDATTRLESGPTDLQ